MGDHKVRFLLTILFVVIGIVAFAYSMTNLLSAGKGWQEIEVDSSEGTSCSEDFVLLYDIGAGEESANAEAKKLKAAYTDLMITAYEDFHTQESFDDVTNLYSINQHPNEVLTVDDCLYQALEEVSAAGDRKIYLGPVYATYDDIFYCEEDSQVAEFDPATNQEMADYYQEIADFANDPESVNVELLGKNQVKLTLSEEYEAFAKENGITHFLDFSWMTNAFITDYVAESLTDQGFTHGSISSYDGFSRNFDDRTEVSYQYNRYQLNGSTIEALSDYEYSGRRSFVNLRIYQLSDQDQIHYYETKDGRVLTLYLDPADGCCKHAANELYATSKEAGCGEILLAVSPYFIADQWDDKAGAKLEKAGIELLE